MWLGEPVTGALEKPVKPRKSPKRSDAFFKGAAWRRWKNVRAKFVAGKADYRGYYQCAHCTSWFKEIEVDHKIKRSVAPHLRYVQSNLQLLCHTCHVKKDSGMVVK